MSARPRTRRFMMLGAALAVATLVLLITRHPASEATSGGDPYAVPMVTDTDPDPKVVETTLVAEEDQVDIGNGVLARAQTFNGTIPGPTFDLQVGDTVVVHYENHLSHDSGVHWHGVELANSMDGTPFTQNMVPPGGSFLYKFTVNRPGLFWYHPHHHASTNQVFKGLYGMIRVEDPNENQLQASGTLPSDSQTKPIVLSDITVCKTPGTNPVHPYDDNADGTPGVTQPWAGGGGVANTLPAQPLPSPKNLCEGPAVNAGVVNPYPVDEDGNLRGPFAAGDVPNIQSLAHAGRTNEGTTVLTNGKNVGGRAGGPLLDQPGGPGALAPGASLLNVQPGQGLRLQLVNASTVRYMRLLLTTPNGTQVPLYRVGGEGGLLNNAVEDGGTQGSWPTGFNLGEILLPPGTRADVVAAIPSVPTSGVLTLWTRDYSRTGGGFTDIPTVPVMHLNLSGSTVSPAYSIASGTPLRAATGDPVQTLGPATGNLLNPATFAPPKTGSAAQNIALTQNANVDLGVDGVFGTHDVPPGIDYSDAAHLGSSRYAKQGDILALTAQNSAGNAHHPFHLHGFSIQPTKLDAPPFDPAVGGNDFTWFYPEFRDNVDIPPGYRLNFRVKIDGRPQPDGTTEGGALGRWLFHCHIFFHATDGMLSELVVTSPNGNERPDVNVDNATVTADQGAAASVKGTYSDPEGTPVTLTASQGTVTDDGGGKFTWNHAVGAEETSKVVYITATDAAGLKGQIPFQLDVNATAPKVDKLKVKPKKFAPAKGNTKSDPPAAKKKKGGAKIKFTLSKASRVKFTVKKLKPKKPKVKKRSFSKNLTAGAQKVKFTGRFKGKALTPGKYKLTAVATDGGGLASAKRSTKFKVVRPQR